MFILWYIPIPIAAVIAGYFWWLRADWNPYSYDWRRGKALDHNDYRDTIWFNVYMIPKLPWFWFDNRKWMNLAEGMNKRFTFIRKRRRFWGFFETLNEKGCTYWTLDYREENNNWLASHIVDHVRVLPNETIIGKFHVRFRIRIRGRTYSWLLWLSWFTMEKV